MEIVYRIGLNRKSYELEARKIKGEIFIFRIDYINGFNCEVIFTDHPLFSNKKDANSWIKQKSKDSYVEDKEFIKDYM